MATQINDKQLESLKKYLGATIKNNEEVHPSDMPASVMVFKMLADRGYYVIYEQIENICPYLHSLGNRHVETSNELKEFLQDVARTFKFYLDQKEGIPRWKKPFADIVNDIIAGKEPID